MSATQTSEREQRLGEVLAALLEARERGERPDRDEWLARHPEFAAELAEFFDSADRLESVATPLREAVAPPRGEELPIALPGDHGRLGDFRIVREVGRGGMGVVYEAEQVSLGRRVALKVLPFAATLDPRQLQRFHNEARAAAGLHHTNIVPVYAVGCERGVHYYAMQFIDGRTLAELIAQQRGEIVAQVPTMAEAAAASATTVPPAAQATSAAPRDRAYFRRVAEWGIQAAEALDCAHAVGVVHRDVKPANLIIDTAGRLWVTDFGLAQVQSDARLTVTGDLVGTLRYMSPEQALAKRVVVDHRTDVYSLGATLYELLTLRPAYGGSDRQELLRQIAFEEPPRLRRWGKAIPAELETIVLKAMEKNPQERYATAKELADDLRHWLEDRPIQARRPTVIQKAKKWGRRHPAVIWSSVVLLVMALVGSAISLAIINHAKEEALDEKVKALAAMAAEREAKQTAEAREAEANAVLDFVQHKILAAARPVDGEGGLGYDAKLADAIKAALPFVEKSFTTQPLVEAKLRMAMGYSFWQLGDPKTAAEQYQAARQLFVEHSGPDHADTLKSTNNLANCYSDMGRAQDALKLREETLLVMRAKLGPDHPLTLSCMNNLAISYGDVGRLPEALKLREEILPLMKAKFGPDDLNTLGAMVNLATSHKELGRFVDAIKLLEEALPVLRAKMPDHRFTFNCMACLADAYAGVGRTQDALKLYEETFQLRKARLGPDHPNTLQSMQELGGAYADANRHQDAVKVREEVLRLGKAKLGPEHPETIGYMNWLADSYLAVGEPAKAIAILQDTLTLRERRRPAEPGNTLDESFLAWTHGQIGEGEQARQNYAAAAQAYAKAVQMFEKLDQAGVLRESFRAQLKDYRQRLEQCRKLEAAKKD